MGLSALLAGIHGWSWYMLVNRDNWYMCPINEWGRARPELYEPFRQVVKVYQAMAPAEAEKLTVSAVTFDVLQQAAQQPGQQMLAALYQAGLEYEFFDPACTPWTKPLMFRGGAWLARRSKTGCCTTLRKAGIWCCWGVIRGWTTRANP